MFKRFYDFGLSDEVLNSLSAMGFEEPTHIQKIAIYPALQGKDIIGLAQTGTGKTAAFGIPIVERGPAGKNRHPYAIILVPTRELAVQVAQEMNRIGQHKGIKSVPLYGGQSLERQIKALKKGAHVVVGTPGRLIDHIQRKTLALRDIGMVVLDEADEMLSMGFIDDMERILSEIPGERQTMLFSATMPREIIQISARYMKSPERVSVDPGKLIVSKIRQIFYEVREEDKIKALMRLLEVEDPSLTLVFCHTKRDVDDLSGKLRQMGFDAASIHGDYTQSHRDEVMNQFRKGDLDILVATDVAARGLDIPDVTHVINFSTPQYPDAYVHRIGRTGRAGRTGVAITFVTPREYRHLRLIEKFAKTTIRKGSLPTVDEVKRARENDLVASLEEALSGGGLDRYLPLAEKLLEKYAPRDMMAAALRLMDGGQEIEDIAEFSRARSGERGVTRLFMTAGKKDNIRAGDILKSISAAASIPGKKIGKISIHDTYSFVSVPTDLAGKVTRALNNMMLNGRKIRIHPAREQAA